MSMFAKYLKSKIKKNYIGIVYLILWIIAISFMLTGLVTKNSWYFLVMGIFGFLGIIWLFFVKDILNDYNKFKKNQQ
jgi:hypothetical protein